MFLLFDKVYVKYDFLLENNKPTIIISPNLGSIVWDELAQVHEGIGAQIHNVEMYEQMFANFVAPEVVPPENEDDVWPTELEAIDSPYANDLAFFQDLLDRERVNIHVDTTAYDILFSKFLKIFFPNMSTDTAWKTYNIFRTNSQLLNTTSFIFGIADGEQAQRDAANAWVPRTRAQFLEVYNATTLDLPDADYNTFRTNAKQKMGVEWLIANRLNDGDQTYDVAMGEKMYALMAKRVNEEVTFLKSSLFSNMFRDWSQNVLGIANTVNANTDLMDLKDTNDKTRWIFDDDAKYFKPDYIARHPNIRFSTIRSDILSAVTANTTPIEEALTDTMMDFVYDSVSVQNFTSADITSILDSDRAHLGPSVFECEDRIKVNALFLSYIYKLKNDSDGELGQYNL